MENSDPPEQTLMVPTAGRRPPLACYLPLIVLRKRTRSNPIFREICEESLNPANCRLQIADCRFEDGWHSSRKRAILRIGLIGGFFNLQSEICNLTARYSLVPDT